MLSTRGGDYELHLGEDVSIGYTSHTDKVVRLYLRETFTFLMLTSEASVAVAPQVARRPDRGCLRAMPAGCRARAAARRPHVRRRSNPSCMECVMSESNEALQALQASVDHLKQAVDANASSQAGDTAVLFTVLSLVLAGCRPTRAT